MPLNSNVLCDKAPYQPWVMNAAKPSDTEPARNIFEK